MKLWNIFITAPTHVLTRTQRMQTAHYDMEEARHYVCENST